MDVKTEDFVNIAIRIRPSVNILTESKGIQLLSENPPVLLVLDREQTFTFDNIFSQDITQEEVYSQIVEPLTKKVLAGYNGTVLAYGQTGTGKTYTIGSNPDVYEDAGFIMRTLNQLFNDNKEEYDSITISISFLEIYNDKVYDLLGNHKAALPVKNFKIQGSVQHKVENFEEARACLKLGSNFRHKGETKQNCNSSRSHAIFTIHCLVQHENYKTEAKLNFVDLAGSENVRKTGNEGAQFQEGVHINKGLFNIGRVIKALSTNMSYVPYRQSVITTILRDSLDKSNYITFVACISPDVQDSAETVQTLEFAQGAKKVKSGPEVNNIIQQFKNDNPALFDNKHGSAIKSRQTPLKRHFYSLQVAGSESEAKKLKLGNISTPISTIHEYSSEFIQSKAVTDQSISISPIVRKCTQAIETTLMSKLELFVKAQMHKPLMPQSPQISVQKLQSTITHLVRSEIIQLTGQRPNPSNSIIEKITEFATPAIVARKLDFNDSTSVQNSVFKVPIAPPRQMKKIIVPVDVDDNVPSTSTAHLKPRRSTRLSLRRSSILPFSPPKRRQSTRLTLKAPPTPLPRLKIKPQPTPRGKTMTQQSQPSTSKKHHSYEEHKTNVLNILNNGSEKELQKLPSIGPKTASQIFHYRLLNGNFDTIKDLSKMECWRGNAYRRFLIANLVKPDDDE